MSSESSIAGLKQMCIDLSSEVKLLKHDYVVLQKELNTFKKVFNIHKHVTPSQSFQDLPVNIVQKLTSEPNHKL
jgi:hypothetical protein